MLDQANAVKASYGYTAYGSANAAISKTAAGFTDSNPYKYEGKRFDTGSGTYDMGARRYSPTTGRWLQQDIYYNAFTNLGLTQDPLNANRYSFVGANPVNYVELDGHLLAALDSGGTTIPVVITTRRGDGVTVSVTFQVYNLGPYVALSVTTTTYRYNTKAAGEQTATSQQKKLFVTKQPRSSDWFTRWVACLTQGTVGGWTPATEALNQLGFCTLGLDN